jgi:hypothetical protein
MDKIMTNLENTTFIIPLKIDCEDRKNNLFLNLNYLNFHFKTNVIIYEKGNFIYENKNEIIKKYNNLKLEFLFDKNENEKIFHRTKYLNRMLDIVKTPVVCNYDIDVIFDEYIYKKCETLILQNEFDMIYPYAKGYFQIEVLKNASIERFNQKPFIFDLLTNQPKFDPAIDHCPFNLKYAEYGQAIFFKTSVYRESGGENENFISWGPEDQERYYRFKKLNYKISWMSNNIYHFDHERGIDSGYSNPYLSGNEDLFKQLKSMNESDYIFYYKKQDYYKKYKNIYFNK